MHRRQALGGILAASVCALAACSSPGSSRRRTGASQKLREHLAHLETAGFSGSVLVASRGEIMLSRGYGFRDIGARKLNTSATVFDTCSLTKQFTGAAIARLVSDGKLKFEDTASAYIEGLSGAKAGITLHDLLRHSSGLVSVVGGDYERVSTQDFIQLVDRSSLIAPPGTKFSYSNVGYSLLGMTIERVSGLTYEQYVRQNLLVPAGMQATGYSLPGFRSDDIAVGYKGGERWGRPTEKPWDGGAPYWHLRANGGFLSTTEDLYRWHEALRNRRVLNDVAYARYIAPPLRADETPDSYYAYGWDVHRTNRGNQLIQHNGYNGAFHSDFFRFPAEDVVVISLSNAPAPRFRRLNEDLADIVFGSASDSTVPAAVTPRE